MIKRTNEYGEYDTIKDWLYDIPRLNPEKQGESIIPGIIGAIIGFIIIIFLTYVFITGLVTIIS